MSDLENIIDRIDLIRPQPGDVITIYSNSEIDVETVTNILRNIKDVFPNNTVIIMPDETNLVCYSKEEFNLVIEDLKRLVQDDENLH